MIKFEIYINIELFSSTSQYHRSPIKSSPESPWISQHYGIDVFDGAMKCVPVMPTQTQDVNCLSLLAHVQDFYNRINNRTVQMDLVPGERHADPTPSPSKKNGQIEILVPNDTQCSETYVETLFLIFLTFFRLTNFSF